MRLNLNRNKRHLLALPDIFGPVAIRGVINYRRVRIGHRRLRNIIVNGLPALLVLTLQRYRYTRTMRKVKVAFLIENNFRLIFARIDLDMVMLGRSLRACFGNDLHRRTSGNQTIHTRGTDTNTLLAAAHLQRMKLAAIEQASEYIGNLGLDYAGPVIDNDQQELVVSIFDRLNGYGYVGKNMGLFAGIHRIINRLFDSGQQCLSRIIKTKKVTVLGEKFANTDITLLSSH